MKCSTSCNNCEPDDDEYMTVDILKDVVVENSESMYDDECTHNQKPLQNSSEDSDLISSLENGNNIVVPSLEACSIVYLSGYLANKCLEKFKCEVCRSSLITQRHLNDSNQILILHKTYDHIDKNYCLKYPSQELVEISTLCLEIFNNTFCHIQSDKIIMEHLMNIAKKK